MGSADQPRNRPFDSVDQLRPGHFKKVGIQQEISALDKDRVARSPLGDDQTVGVDVVKARREVQQLRSEILDLMYLRSNILVSCTRFS